VRRTASAWLAATLVSLVVSLAAAGCGAPRAAECYEVGPYVDCADEPPDVTVDEGPDHDPRFENNPNNDYDGPVDLWGYRDPREPDMDAPVDVDEPDVDYP